MCWGEQKMAWVLASLPPTQETQMKLLLLFLAGLNLAHQVHLEGEPEDERPLCLSISLRNWLSNRKISKKDSHLFQAHYWAYASHLESWFLSPSWREEKQKKKNQAIAHEFGQRMWNKKKKIDPTPSSAASQDAHSQEAGAEVEGRAFSQVLHNWLWLPKQ